jgi:hypothetical protein
MLSTVTNNMFIGLFPDFNHYYGVYKSRGYFLVENSIFLKQFSLENTINTSINHLIASKHTKISQEIKENYEAQFPNNLILNNKIKKKTNNKN